MSRLTAAQDNNGIVVWSNESQFSSATNAAWETVKSTAAITLPYSTCYLYMTHLIWGTVAADTEHVRVLDGGGEVYRLRYAIPLAAAGGPVEWFIGAFDNGESLGIEMQRATGSGTVYLQGVSIIARRA